MFLHYHYYNYCGGGGAPTGQLQRTSPHCGHVTPDFGQICGGSAPGSQVASWQKASKSASLQPAFCSAGACIPQQTSHLSAEVAPVMHGQSVRKDQDTTGEGGFGCVYYSRCRRWP
jgi:hypothetical protein